MNLTQMTIISTTVGRNPLEDPLEEGVAIMVNKRVQNAVLGCKLKNDSVRRQGSQVSMRVARVLTIMATPFLLRDSCPQ